MKVNESKCELTDRQEYVMPYLLSCPTQKEAAKNAGLSEKQLTQWFKNPLFKEELNNRRKEVFEDSMQKIQGATLEAINTLVDLMKDEDSRVKLSACDKVLSYSFKSKEIFEICNRIEQLELKIEGERL